MKSKAKRGRLDDLIYISALSESKSNGLAVGCFWFRPGPQVPRSPGPQVQIRIGDFYNDRDVVGWEIFWRQSNALSQTFQRWWIEGPGRTQASRIN